MLARVCTLPWTLALTSLFALHPPMPMLGSQLMTEPFAALLLLLACRLMIGFGWGTTGGEHLYRMSIDGEDVWGSWVASDEVSGIDFPVREGHAAEVLPAEAPPGAEAQRYYARLALQHIRENPWHLARNVVANGTRVLFNYPFSFRPQSLYTCAYLLPDMALYLALALSFALLPLTARRQHPGLLSVVALAMIYLGGNILVGSTGRQGVALVGLLSFWLAFRTRLLIEAGYIAPGGRRSVVGRVRVARDRNRWGSLRAPVDRACGSGERHASHGSELPCELRHISSQREKRLPHDAVTLTLLTHENK